MKKIKLLYTALTQYTMSALLKGQGELLQIFKHLDRFPSETVESLEELFGNTLILQFLSTLESHHLLYYTDVENCGATEKMLVINEFFKPTEDYIDLHGIAVFSGTPTLACADYYKVHSIAHSEVDLTTKNEYKALSEEHSTLSTRVQELLVELKEKQDVEIELQKLKESSKTREQIHNIYGKFNIEDLLVKMNMIVSTLLIKQEEAEKVTDDTPILSVCFPVDEGELFSIKEEDLTVNQLIRKLNVCTRKQLKFIVKVNELQDYFKTVDDTIPTCDIIEDMVTLFIAEQYDADQVDDLLDISLIKPIHEIDTTDLVPTVDLAKSNQELQQAIEEVVDEDEVDEEEVDEEEVDEEDSEFRVEMSEIEEQAVNDFLELIEKVKTAELITLIGIIGIQGLEVSYSGKEITEIREEVADALYAKIANIEDKSPEEVESPTDEDEGIPTEDDSDFLSEDEAVDEEPIPEVEDEALATTTVTETIKEEPTFQGQMYEETVTDFIDLMQTTNPHMMYPKKHKTVVKSCRTLDLIVNKDGVSIDDLMAALTWAIQDSNWSKYIITLAALRKTSPNNGLMKYCNIMNSFKNAVEEGTAHTASDASFKTV